MGFADERRMTNAAAGGAGNCLRLERREGLAMIRRFTATFFGLGLLLAGLSGAGTAQQLSDFAEVSSGEGTLISNNGDSLNINAIAVFLRRNGEAEIWLMTGRENVYAGGRWGASTSRTVALEITDDTEGCGASGCGTVFLQAGCMPVAGLRIVISRSDGLRFEADFVAKNAKPCLNLQQAGSPEDHSIPRRFDSVPFVHAGPAAAGP